MDPNEDDRELVVGEELSRHMNACHNPVDMATCGTCRYWEEHGEPIKQFLEELPAEVIHEGACQRYPPVHFIDGMFQWPTTSCYHWCGEWHEEP